MDELVDIYDDNGKFLRTEMKSVAHKNGDWHKAIHAILLNGKNEVLMQKRAASKALFPNLWDISFAGHVGAGEDSLISAMRECSEELGIDLGEDEIAYAFSVKESDLYGDIVNNEMLDVFICKKDFDLSSVKLQEEEVSEFKVVPIPEFIRCIRENKGEMIEHGKDEYDGMIKILTEFEKHPKADIIGEMKANAAASENQPQR